MAVPRFEVVQTRSPAWQPAVLTISPSIVDLLILLISTSISLISWTQLHNHAMPPTSATANDTTNNIITNEVKRKRMRMVEAVHLLQYLLQESTQVTSRIHRLGPAFFPKRYSKRFRSLYHAILQYDLSIRIYCASLRRLNVTKLSDASFSARYEWLYNKALGMVVSVNNVDEALKPLEKNDVNTRETEAQGRSVHEKRA